jgi:hypothetical protein
MLAGWKASKLANLKSGLRIKGYGLESILSQGQG